MKASLVDVASCLRFYSRLPVPALPGEADPHKAPDFARIAAAVPVAGVAIALVGALVLGAARGLGIGELTAAALSVAALVLATGAFHEDGLADTADSFGGSTREARLSIMADSRIGTYGAAALILALLLRVSLIAELTQSALAVALASILAAGAVSRTAALWLAVKLPAAREKGAAFAAGRPAPRAFLAAVAIACAIAGAVLWPTAGPKAALAALLAAAAVAAAMAAIAARSVGGQTGDFCGATQQVAEVAFLLAVLILADPAG